VLKRDSRRLPVVFSPKQAPQDRVRDVVPATAERRKRGRDELRVGTRDERGLGKPSF
jgi:hypothetical protein